MIRSEITHFYQEPHRLIERCAQTLRASPASPRECSPRALRVETLIERVSSQKQRRRDGRRSAAAGRNPHVTSTASAHERTHVAPHEPQAKLFKKSHGQAAKLCYMGHVLMEHRQVCRWMWRSPSDGFAERETALGCLSASAQQPNSGRGQVYDTRLRRRLPRAGVTPHIAQSLKRAALRHRWRTTRHRATCQSTLAQAHREIFAGARRSALRKMRVRGLPSVRS